MSRSNLRLQLIQPWLGLSLMVHLLATGYSVLAQDLPVRTQYKAILLQYNPHVWKNGQYLTVQEAYNYRDVDKLCSDYINFLRKASGGQVNFSIESKFVLDEFPPDNDPAVDFTP
ncbi:MAG TPA: hypothetical protein VEC99_05595, partial [Clostridia bacterium]|nr:hypothetical protein [Clostridia bacterium]